MLCTKKGEKKLSIAVRFEVGGGLYLLVNIKHNINLFSKRMLDSYDLKVKQNPYIALADVPYLKF